MDPSDFADLLGGLAVVSLVVAAVGIVLWWRGGPTADLVATMARPAALLVAVTATGSSLWFSESAGFPPCQLCWYQRIAIYPLVIVLGLRLFDSTAGLRRAAFALVGAGLAVNLWHVTIETWPSLDSGSCDAAVPCTIRWVEGLGLLTIPRLATVVLLLVLTSLVVERPRTTTPSREEVEA